jgi:hypothetical protein
LTLIELCLIAVFGMTSTGAQAGNPPRWYGKKTGTAVPYSANAGLVELTSPETLQGTGKLSIVSKNHSSCLVKSRESIEDPSALLPGTGEMEEFEVVCEEGTGPGPNEAAVFPCVTGEPFELYGMSLNWPSTLEADPTPGAGRGRVRDLPTYYDSFTGVDVEVYCLTSREHAEYKGSLRPEVEVGRLQFLGPKSGELEEASSGSRFSLGGTDYVAPEKYKDVRVNSEYYEKPTITSLTPNDGPTAGRTKVTVDGSGFALGTGTRFDFGKTAGSSVDCTSTTECTVTVPAHRAGTVVVIVVVGKTKSKESTSADQYTYQ